MTDTSTAASPDGQESHLDALRSYGTAILFDAIETSGMLPQVLDGAITAQAGSERTVGRAFTVTGRPDPRPRSEHLPAPWEGFQMFDAIDEGDIIVIATGGETVAGVWGQIMTTAAAARGARGVVIDGLTRDLQRLTELEAWSVFCRGATPVEGDGRWQPVEYDVPITMPGRLHNAIRVTPDDIVVGDRDGVLIIPEAIVPEVLRTAAEITRSEQAMIRDLVSGTRFEDAYARHQAF